MKHLRLKSRASIMIVVLVTIIVAATALLVFIGKASDDLLVESRSADARRLRSEALDSLETVLAVLQDFKTVNSSLRSPSEGWGDPLAWAGYTPTEGRTVTVEFKDESGKISLPRVTQPMLVSLFVSWGILQTDADRLADALLYWMKHDHVPTSSYTPTYELDTLACEPPGRSVRSMGELASIDIVREFFFEEDGRPNAYWQRFVQSVSLLDFAQTNINGASADVLAASGYELTQQNKIVDYLNGTGYYEGRGAGYFQNASDVSAIAGGEVSGSGFGTSIQALRIIITVREGRSSYRLNTVVSFTGNNAAKTVDTKATSEKNTSANTSTNTNKSGTRSTSSSDVTTTVTGSSSSGSASGQQKINYPFVILEMRENDEIAKPLPTNTTTP